MCFNNRPPRCYRPLRRFALSIAILSGAIIAVYSAGIRINIDNSVHRVFWLVSKPVPQRNSYVVVCLPSWFVARHSLAQYFPGKGRCGGILPLLKQVVAVENDNIKIDHGGIVVNEIAVPHSQPLFQLQWRIAYQKSRVPKNKIVIAGQTNDSLDSRYFGLIDVKWVESSAIPLF